MCLCLLSAGSDLMEKTQSSLPEGGPVMSLLIEAPAVYGKKQHSRQAAYLLKALWAWCYQRKAQTQQSAKKGQTNNGLGNQSSPCIPAAVRCKLNASQQDLSHWRKAAFNQSHPQLFSLELTSASQISKPSYKSYKIFSVAAVLFFLISGATAAAKRAASTAKMGK